MHSVSYRFLQKNSHGTWQASNLRSPLQPPLQSCNWKGLNVPNLNGCFFWRPTATTRKKQLWSWGPRGIPRLNLVFYRMAVFYEEPGMVAFSQKSCSNQATHWATEASLSRSEIPSGRWRQPWSKSLREQLRGIDDLRETGNEAPCLELKNKTAPVYCWVCVCILSTWFHAQNTTISVNAELDKNIGLHVPPAIKTRPSHLSDWFLCVLCVTNVGHRCPPYRSHRSFQNLWKVVVLPCSNRSWQQRRPSTEDRVCISFGKLLHLGRKSGTSRNIFFLIGPHILHQTTNVSFEIAHFSSGLEVLRSDSVVRLLLSNQVTRAAIAGRAEFSVDRPWICLDCEF